MRVYSAPRNIWRAVYPTLVYFCAQILTSVVIGAAYGIWYAVNGDIKGPEAPQEIARILLENTALMALVANALCLAVFLPVWLKTKRGLAQYRLINPATVAVAAVFAFLGLNTLVELILSVCGIYRFFPSYEIVTQAIGAGHPFIRFIWLVVSAPVVEELCLRGITLNRLLSWTPAWVAVTAQSALFAVLHMNLLQGLYAFVLGLALGYLYLRCRRLWLCIAAHAAFNLVGFAQSVAEQNGAGFSIWLLLSGAAVFVLAAWLFMRHPPSYVREP